MVSFHEAYWYAFVTKPRHEKKAKKYLDGAGITSYLPLRKTLNQWKDRKKWVESPVFSSYIFCNIPFSHRFSVLEYPSVVRIVSFNQQPTPVQEKEIKALKMLLATEIQFDVRPGLVEGDNVRITSGLLMGYEGLVTQERGAKLFALNIGSLGKSIVLDASQVKLEKI